MPFSSRTFPAACIEMLRPQALKLAAGLAGMLVLAGCVGDADKTPLFYRDLATPGAQVSEAAAASMISHYRANNGLGAVTVDPALSAIARSHAEALAKAGTVRASLAPEQQLSARLAAIGEPSTEAVENVSAGYRTLAEAFSGWRESPKHNAVMLDEPATRIGIATAYSAGAKHKVFWSLVMAGPKNAPVQGKPAKN
ncbi:CAP domain-containing protein [Roseibium hamelinense]|nr:CAP domain-containing protein [Roseibium hamelinense]